MRTGIAATAAVVFASGTAAAQGIARDSPTPRPSPEASSGVEPRVTREVDRPTLLPDGWDGRVPAEDGERTPIAGRTTTTSATFGPASPETPSRSRPSRPLWIGGGALFLGAYGASVVVASTVGADVHEDRFLAVPLVGPWITLSKGSCALGECGVSEDINFLGLVGSGVAQAAGVGMVLASFVLREDAGSRRAGVRVIPTAGRGTAGLRAVGTF